MSWGQLQVGKLLLYETNVADRKQHETFGTKSVTVSGTHFWPGSSLVMTEEALKAACEDILWLKDKFCPVTFSRKTDMSGYYVVTDSGATYTMWNGEARFFNWSIDMQYIGPDSAIDIESRMSNVVRANNYSLTGERWHAPAVGHYGYYTGTTPPSGSVIRPSSYGNMTVYRTIPTGVNPRWGCATSNMLNGRVVIASAGIARGAENCAIPTTTWVIDNGLVRVAPLASSGLLSIGVWNGSGWDNKAWNVGRAGVNFALSSFNAATILRNDIEAVTLRLIMDRNPGRNTLDLTVRRGSRLVEGLLSTDSSANLTITLQTTETQTDNTASGYVVATGDDANADRYIAGSSKTVTAVAGGGIQRASQTVMDFYIGVVYNGGAAISGDQATNIRDQYIGSMAESTMGVRR